MRVYHEREIGALQQAFLEINQHKRLPSVLDSPKSVSKSASFHVKGAAVVLTIEIHQSSPIIIPVHPNKQMGRGKFYNVVASVYAKFGPDPESKWKEQGLLLWVQ